MRRLAVTPSTNFLYVRCMCVRALSCSAYFPFIFNITGGVALVQQFGPWFSWANTSRANIFRRDHVKVTDDASFKRLIRYNDFESDPLSTQGCTQPPSSAENAIACRDDLNPINGTYSISALGHRDHVAIDAKYTSYARMANGGLTAATQAGPTYDQQPVFSFSNTTPDLASLPHYGLPDTWKFPWMEVTWN
ncbi:hypothetical protein EON66_03850 [archaeon]|nr:MAG: hypothetical protein EON66_03850 [archaeon]